MDNGIDHDTGEIGLPAASVRAATASAQARVQIERDRSGYGAAGLHFAIWQAVQKMPVWIKAEKEGARSVKYAPLKDILSVVRPILSEHGIRVRQGADRSWPADEGGGVKGRLVPVYTDLIHVPTGDMERTQIEMPLMKLDPQGMGSAIMYGRRYTLLAALGLTTDEADNDGAKAVVRKLGEKSQNSPECQALLDEIAAAKNIEALTKWSGDKKNTARLNQLEEAESERVLTAYTDRRETLSAAE